LTGENRFVEYSCANVFYIRFKALIELRLESRDQQTIAVGRQSRVTVVEGAEESVEGFPFSAFVSPRWPIFSMSYF
jgi:hypothetical protein